MSLLSLANPALGAISAAALAGSAAYLDAKYSFRRDVKQLLGDKRFKARLDAWIEKLGDRTNIYHMLELADQNADGLWFEGQTWKYGDIKKRKYRTTRMTSSQCLPLVESDAVAEVLYQHGVRKGTFVAVFMTNTPEMVFTMNAISKLGAISAFINTALRSKHQMSARKVY
jgi:long-subunit acyl-CoA synthetase (AMP-forming)